MTELPPMTDERGRYWDQPAREAVLVDDTHAVMTQATFDALADYSMSEPSGVYEGKLWKSQRLEGRLGIEAIRQTGEWFLRWYGPSAMGVDYCSVSTRRILIV